MKKPPCPNASCSTTASVIHHGCYKTRSGKRRRYRCRSCGKTFCSTTETPYHRLHHQRSTFDDEVHLSVEGVNKSAIARLKRLSWNTVARWLEKAAGCCRRFNPEQINELGVPGIQADEIRTIVGDKDSPVWVFTTLDVWSRLWPTTVVGRRSYRNTYALLKDTVSRMRPECFPLIVTDGFEYYAKVVWRLFGRACVYGQVIKTRRNDRIVKVERRRVIGATWRFEQALTQSEDSSKLNTSFIERLNLTIRQGSSSLYRRTLCHARSKNRLEDQLELLRCYYNFVRSHRSLRRGRQAVTPAMQAGLTKRPFTLREIFSSRILPLSPNAIAHVFAGITAKLRLAA